MTDDEFEAEVRKWDKSMADLMVSIDSITDSYGVLLNNTPFGIAREFGIVREYNETVERLRQQRSSHTYTLKEVV